MKLYLVFRMALLTPILLLTTFTIANHPPEKHTTTNHPMNLMESMKASMDKMMAMKMTGDYDYDFATMMIEHHKGGIAMAKIELKTGSDSIMKRKASKIIMDQNKEIFKLKTFLKDHTVKKTSQAMPEMNMNGMNMSMSGNTDKDFATMMISHHKDAISMSEGEMTNGHHAGIKKMAQEIIDKQTKEIKAFQAWLDAR